MDLVVEGTYGKLKKASLTADGLVLLDKVVEGTYGRVKSASLTAEGLVLLDKVKEGTYGLLLTTQISAGKIYLSSQSAYAGGYDPSGKEIMVHRGTSPPADTSKLWFDTATALMKAYVAGAWKVLEGEWYLKSGVLIDATKGIRLYGKDMAFGTFANETDARAGTNWQTKMGSDGKIYAGAGAVSLDISGLSVVGERVSFYYGATKIGIIGGGSAGIVLRPETGKVIGIGRSGEEAIWTDGDIIPNTIGNIGKSSRKYGKIYGNPIIKTSAVTGEEGAIYCSSYPRFFVYVGGAWRYVTLSTL